MINEALKLLNNMLELSLINDVQTHKHEIPISKDWSSKRLLYVMNLKCIKVFEGMILEPENSIKIQSGREFSMSISMSIICQVAHYVNPSKKLDLSSIKTKTLRFLTLVCKLWKLKHTDSNRPDLYLIL